MFRFVFHHRPNTREVSEIPSFTKRRGSKTTDSREDPNVPVVSRAGDTSVTEEVYTDTQQKKTHREESR